MKNNIIYAILWATMILGGWIAATAFSERIASHKVISPEPGVKCVVVSRAFNTSVDCWKISGSHSPRNRETFNPYPATRDDARYTSIRTAPLWAMYGLECD